MKTYSVYVKSHCEAPDFETEIRAENKQDAIVRLERQGVNIETKHLKEI